MTTATPQTTPETLTQASIDWYREHGFVRIPGIITPDEAAHFYEVAQSASSRLENFSGERPIFNQYVNVWQHDEPMRALTLHPNVGAVAQCLAGVPIRLWHDQILTKPPHNNAATEFHQDQPYWPHATSPNPISAWIALCDVPVEKGCMTFIDGSHRHTDLPGQRLDDPNSLFGLCPELQWEQRITVPLKAGDCTFHHGRCAHMATPNFTDDPRVAFVVIFMDATTTFSGNSHVVTIPLGLEVGAPLDGELFPLVGS